MTLEVQKIDIMDLISIMKQFDILFCSDGDESWYEFEIERFFYFDSEEKQFEWLKEQLEIARKLLTIFGDGTTPDYAFAPDFDGKFKSISDVLGWLEEFVNSYDPALNKPHDVTWIKKKVFA